MNGNTTYTAHKQEEAEEIVVALVRRSLWFTVEPLPNDEWLFTTRDEPGLPWR